MGQLTLEQAAVKYDTDNFSYPTPGSNVLIPETTARQWNINAFTAGAEWQKEQYRDIKEALEIGLSYIEGFMEANGQNPHATPKPGSRRDKVIKAIELLTDK